MHLEFNLRMDKVSSQAYAPFEPEEIDKLLNRAERKFILTRYSDSNNRREGFQEVEKRRRELGNLITHITIVPTVSATMSNTYTFSLPPEHWLTLSERTTVSTTDCHGDAESKAVQVVPRQWDDWEEVLKDPFNKPNNEEIISTEGDAGVLLTCGSGDTITLYEMWYLREPINMELSTSTNCDLPSITHDDIIDIAVSLALEETEAPRWQTNKVETTINE